MASGERRMLFDTRGRRRHVIRVVYAILALLMGASLFLVVGPVNIGSLLGNQTSGSSAAQVFEEQAERIEGRLVKSPGDEGMLLSLTRARLGAANAQLEGSTEAAAILTPEAIRNYEAAAVAWQRYLKRASEPSPTAAQLVASSFVKAAEGSSSFRESEADIGIAAEAQKIAAEERPSLGTLSSLAIYQYFNGEFAAADKSVERAAAEATSKTEAKGIEQQLAQYRKNAEKFAKQKKEINKVEREASKEKLTSPNPLTGLGLGG